MRNSTGLDHRHDLWHYQPATEQSLSRKENDHLEDLIIIEYEKRWGTRTKFVHLGRKDLLNNTSGLQRLPMMTANFLRWYPGNIVVFFAVNRNTEVATPYGWLYGHELVTGPSSMPDSVTVLNDTFRPIEEFDPAKAS